MNQHLRKVLLLFLTGTSLILTKNYVSSVECDEKYKYRSINGSCNNLKNTQWGATNTTYGRLLPSRYGDNISEPRRAKNGKELPNPRLLSLALFSDLQVHDLNFTVNNIGFGQVVTHDMSNTLRDSQQNVDYDKCCTSDGQFKDPSSIPKDCLPIRISKDDPAHSKENRVCMHFARTLTDHDMGSGKKNQPAQQLSQANHFLDLSIIYGNTEEVSKQLREHKGGRLRVDIRDGRMWPPRQKSKTLSCNVKSSQEACYDMSADDRNNQNPHVVVVGVIWLREHNRVADALAQINSHWDDERLFQEARNIVIAEYQHIAYYEWLPILLGRTRTLNKIIISATTEFVKDYDKNVNPSVLNEHAQAAFRHFHVQIVGQMALVNESRAVTNRVIMSDWFQRPQIIEEDDNFDKFVRGLATQPELASNRFMDSEITQFFFRNTKHFGRDLKAIDIQRDREHGLATYNDAREFCGLPRAQSFKDFSDHISKNTVAFKDIRILATLYESPDDVDLTVGGSLEHPEPYTLAGYTFLCILAEQFYRTKVGDRFWFEYRNNGFSESQLNEIRKTTISKIFCDNGDHIESMQRYGFSQISELNELTSCKNLPYVNLSYWKDNAKDTSNREAELQSSF